MRGPAAAVQNVRLGLRVARGALYRQDFYAKFGNFACHFGTLIVRFRSSRCDGWIGAVEKWPVEVSRSLGEVWEPFFERVNFSESPLKITC